MQNPNVKTILKAVAGIAFLGWLLFLTLKIRHAEQIVAVTCGVDVAIVGGAPQGMLYEQAPCNYFLNLPINWPPPVERHVSDEVAQQELDRERDRDFPGYKLKNPVMGRSPSYDEINRHFGYPTTHPQPRPDQR